MQQTPFTCYTSVGDKRCCVYCHKNCCIKYGKSAEGKQRYRCKECNKSFIRDYSYQACHHAVSGWIVKLLKEGSGIRSIARLLQISITTVLRRILKISKQIRKPAICLNQEYEIDELRTFYKNKGRLLWIVYALQRNTGKIVDFAVGSRTIKTLQKVTTTVLLSSARKVYTDKLPVYSYLLPRSIHCSKAYSINHIERNNLTLRTHLKRLGRKTICFSKSIVMLEACIKIYFWFSFL